MFKLDGYLASLKWAVWWHFTIFYPQVSDLLVIRDSTNALQAVQQAFELIIKVKPPFVLWLGCDHAVDEVTFVKYLPAISDQAELFYKRMVFASLL
tara:strand:- start:1289 stop:1576 length:288 start_codon:yes stop_codon:yes gene_type:complete